MAAILNLQSLPLSFEQVSNVFQPKSISDYVAISLFVALSSSYALKGKLWDKPDPYHYKWFERPQQLDGSSFSSTKATRNIAQKLEESNKDCVIFWGSQSGTAEGFAYRLAKECELRFSLHTMVADLSDYDAESIAFVPDTKLAVFLLSTYGEGDPSDNAAGFWDWITKLSEKSLTNVRYVAFGLGNSNYKYYNRVVDVVTDRMNELGARQLLPVGKADDAERSTEEDFVTWKTEVFRMLRQEFNLEEHSVVYQPTLDVVEDDSLDLIDLHLDEPLHPRDNPKAAAQSSPIRPLAIKQTRQIFASGDRSCVHMEFDIADQAELVYKTGDHLAVWPINPVEEVEILLRATGLSARRDIPILLRAIDSDTKLKVPSPTTFASLFTTYLEIGAPVSRETIMALAAFAPTPEANASLLQLGQDREYFSNFLSHSHLTFGRVLSLAAPGQVWASLPLSFMIEYIPVMQPRYYSISSSSVLSPRRIAITALVSADSLPAIAPSSSGPAAVAGTIHGITTNYLLAHHHTTTPATKELVAYNFPTTSPASIFAHIRKSKFKLPISKTTPVIMVAAGTGLAPFRAFIAERAKLAATGQDVGQMILFFGCRSPDEDYIYKDELEAIQKDTKMTLDIVTAFSRVHTGMKKVYVQDRVAENGERVMQLLADERASLYVCGRTSMAKEVAKRVTQVAGQSGRFENEAQASDWVEALKRQGKWREDVWG